MSGADRHKDLAAEAEECRARVFKHADHGKLAPVDAYALIEWIPSAEQRLGDRRADDGGIQVVLYMRGVYELTFIHVHIANGGVARRHSDDLCARVFPACHNLCVRVDLGRDSLYGWCEYGVYECFGIL